IISILPFVGSPVFRAVVLNSRQSEKFLHMSLPVSGAEGVSIFILIWGYVFFRLFFSRQKPLWWSYLAAFIGFFAVTHYHPQWFVWLTPLLFLALAEGGKKVWPIILAMMGTWLVLTLMFEPSLNYAFFIPLKPSLVDGRQIRDYVTPYYDVFQLMTIMRSLFAAAGLALVVFLGKKLEEVRRR
ncbi:hypothetical protein MUP65_02360, partial [Patescibacteria group bacterium]|nr:hypothetical protein [Patescibacteria group bacterium]